MVAQNFPEAVLRLVNNWTALILCLKHSDSAHQFHRDQFLAWVQSAIVQWFSENTDLTTGEVTSFLEDIVSNELGEDISIEDGSTSELAELLVRFYYIQSQQELQAEIEKLPKCDLEGCRGGDDDDDVRIAAAATDNPDAAASSAEPSRPAVTRPQPDEDGFITVTRRKKR